MRCRHQPRQIAERTLVRWYAECLDRGWRSRGLLVIVVRFWPRVMVKRLKGVARADKALLIWPSLWQATKAVFTSDSLTGCSGHPVSFYSVKAPSIGNDYCLVM